VKPRILILHAPGTNRDPDLAHALELAGGAPEIVTLPSLREMNPKPLDYAMLALPGGFSYGDALGAGRLWALDLQTWFTDFLQAFVQRGRPVLGICNGFQALVKAGVLPGAGMTATLTFNLSGHFECRWVTLIPNVLNSSPWLYNLPPLDCPVAHGEGRFLWASGQDLPASVPAFYYASPDGALAGGVYPANPNGSPGDIAGVTNPAGNVLGLMPHPEDHIYPYQHPRWTRAPGRTLALAIFQNGLKM